MIASLRDRGSKFGGSRLIFIARRELKFFEGARRHSVFLTVLVRFEPCFAEYSRVVTERKFGLKRLAIHEGGSGGEWTSRRTKASSRTSARLWDNLAVINIERKYTYTRAQEYEHLGSLHFGRGSDIAGSSVLPLSHYRQLHRTYTCSLCVRVSFSAWSSFDTRR